MAKKDKPPPAPPRPTPAFLLSEANDDLFGWGGRLRDLRIPKANGTGEEVPGRWVHHCDYGPLGSQIQFFEPVLFEQLCDADAGVQGALRQCHRKDYNDASLAKLQAAVMQVYENDYLPEMIRRFDEASPLLARYFAAKHAWKRARPEDFEEQPFEKEPE